ncbi:MAG: EF-P lysine aminoacylase GenX [Deltaproteobacteria bacterium]|nr:EF-P lysine aminoacylase GenX [Deltaproteobacteria bacterium]
MSPGSRNNPPLEEPGSPADRKQYLWQRARMVQSIRAFFMDRHYLEVETPQLVSSLPPEVHIDPISAGGRYLHTSPEICMKRLLAAGYSRIFQISKCFRLGERGDFHLPEFTLLEWYRAGTHYKALMEECEELFLRVSQDLGKGNSIHYQGREVDFGRPWERISVKEAFDRFASLTLEKALEKGCFDEIVVKEIESHLGTTRPAFLYDYPASHAALARLSPENFSERFEIYIGGLELANGFSELTDAQEQRVRFERDRRYRESLGKKAYPMPEKFLASLKHMPEAAGIALGVDRLAMIFTDRAMIDDVVPFTPEEV